MDEDMLFAKAREYGIQTKEQYVTEAFCRNIGFLSEEEQRRLAGATVAIPGMGGVGGVHCITLARTGIGRFHLADADIYEPANVNRQFGATAPAFGRPKIEVMREHALAVNPFLEIRQFPEGVSAANIDAFLDGVDVVLDGIDIFNIEVRRLLFNQARERGIHVITAAPLGFSAALLVFSPQGMSFDDYFALTGDPVHQVAAFIYGVAPEPTFLEYLDFSMVNLAKGAGPSLGIGCQICSAVAATEAVRILLGRPGLKPAPCYSVFDPYLQRYCTGELPQGNRSPEQQQKIKQFVERLLAHAREEQG